MSHERTNYAVIEDTGEDCTKTHCTSYSRSIKQVRCDGCERELCGSCAIKLGDDVYCPACAVCGVCKRKADPGGTFAVYAFTMCACGGQCDQRGKCDRCGNMPGAGLAVAWCSDCGERLCEHHSAKLPDADLCIECASDRREAMIHQDEIQLDIYRHIEAQSNG